MVFDWLADWAKCLFMKYLRHVTLRRPIHAVKSSNIHDNTNYWSKGGQKQCVFAMYLKMEHTCLYFLLENNAQKLLIFDYACLPSLSTIHFYPYKNAPDTYILWHYSSFDSRMWLYTVKNTVFDSKHNLGRIWCVLCI